jgi:nucleotide-binding universal stress UspA family protein
VVGTRESKIALQRARALALALGASLRLLTVVHPPRADGHTQRHRVRAGEIPPEPEKVLSRGMTAVGPSRNPQLGSTELTRIAPCPVLVTPRGD